MDEGEVELWTDECTARQWYRTKGTTEWFPMPMTRTQTPYGEDFRAPGPGPDIEVEQKKQGHPYWPIGPYRYVIITGLLVVSILLIVYFTTR